MGKKRKERTGRQETLIPNPEAGHHEEDEEESKEGEKRFFACYLLCSLSPRFKGHTYIGFTVNPCRRIRQHNGEITSGAWRTKRKRPWEMVLCIYGFSTNVAALQFEWAWQHPRESLAVRKAAASLKSLSGVANHIKLAYTMLTLPPWQSLKLTVNFFSTKYTKHSSGCPSLPKQMRVQVCPMDDLSSYIGRDQILEENEDDDWEDEDNENGNSDENVRETQIDMPVHNSVDTTLDLQRRVEDCDLRQQRESRNSSGDYQEMTYPLIGSPSGGSTSIPSLDNTGVEDREPSWLIGESTNTLGRPTDVSSDQSPFNVSFLASPEVGFKQRKDSFAGENEEDEEPSNQFDSPVVAPSSTTGLVNRMEVVDNIDAFGSSDLNSKIQPASKHHLESPKASNTTTRSLSTNSFHFSSEVEVINLLTPSSDCVIGSFHKKKRATRACHDIIDLTKSPLFVQL